jgi:hypothetical protein
MAQDVFISYAVEDREAADKVCGALEGQGIKCWMAPRDVPYGADYEEAIVDAITASRLLVLILSPHSNASPHVKREIQNACAEGSQTQIIPLRIGDVPYNKALRYYLGSAQWLDASTPPLENHLQPLVRHVRARLGGEPSGGTGAKPDVQEQVLGEPEGRRDAAVPVGGGTGDGRTFQGTGDGQGLKGTGDGRTVQGTGDGRKPLPVVWLAVGAGVLLALVVAVVVVATRSGGGNATSVSPNANLATPAASPNVNQQGGGTPQPRTPTPTPTPAPARTPIRRFPTNLNLRRTLNQD